MPTVILRPNGAGTYTNIPGLTGAATHWQAVNEAVADDNTSYVSDSTNGEDWDTYTMEDMAGDVTISKIVFHGRFKVAYTPIAAGHCPNMCYITPQAATRYEMDSNDSYTADVWQDLSYEATTNPQTLVAFTVSDVNGMEIGVGLQSTTIGAGQTSYCTQLYAEVFYTNNAPTFPTDDITRVTGIKHIFKNKLLTGSGKPQYVCKVQLGGLAQLDGIDALTGTAEPIPDNPADPAINPTVPQINQNRPPGTPIYAPGHLSFGWSAVVQGAIPKPVPPGSTAQPFWKATPPQPTTPTFDGGFVESPFTRGIGGGGGEVV